MRLFSEQEKRASRHQAAQYRRHGMSPEQYRQRANAALDEALERATPQLLQLMARLSARPKC